MSVHCNRVHAAELITLSSALEGFITLGVPIVLGADGALPKEVRIFKYGVNQTEKGPFLFDEQAARSVMEHYHAHGVRIMIDLDHLSLDKDSVNYDPDPRAWTAFEIRSDGLWITSIEWLEDGERRLKGKLQPYLSPAFKSDAEGRIVFIRNVAMTAMPATHGAVQLCSATSKGKPMDPMKEFIRLCARLSKSRERVAGRLIALAEGDAPAKGKAAAVSEAADAAMAALEDFMKTAKGSDIDATFAALDAAKKAVDAFENAASALTGASPDADAAPAAAEPADMSSDETVAKMTALSAATGKASFSESVDEIKRLQAIAVEYDASQRAHADQLRKVEAGERREIVGKLVTMGVITPGQAWADDAATTPKGVFATASISDLKELVGDSGQQVPARVQVPGALGSVTQTSKVNISDYELNRLHATLDREMRASPKARFYDKSKAENRYYGIRCQQLAGAEQKGMREQCNRFARAVNELDALTSADGQQLVQLASVAVIPIAQMPASSQRAMEEFRLEFNTTLVSQPIPWAEDLGVVLTGGGLKDTYPLAFYAVKYREQKAENPEAVQPAYRDVSVSRKLFSAAATAELIRITRGDFGYVQAWNQQAAAMARARINLRNHLIAALLTDTDGFTGALTGYWGLTPDQPTGIDGQPFFSANHQVNPFNTHMKFHGAAVWSNLTGSASPLSASTLTAAKAAMLLVPGPDGEEMGSSATGMLTPTTLKEQGRLLLTVQDLILRGGTVDGVSNAFAGVRNEHFNSGFEHMWGPQLAGTGTDADYYLFSRETIARGLPPWVLAEDAAEEIRQWDESSDHYKNTGFIKIGSYVFCNAALLYPHGIRLVKGS